MYSLVHGMEKVFDTWWLCNYYLIIRQLSFVQLQVGSHHVCFSYEVFPGTLKILPSLDVGVLSSLTTGKRPYVVFLLFSLYSQILGRIGSSKYRLMVMLSTLV